MEQNIVLENRQAFRQLQKQADFEIMQCEGNVDLDNTAKFTKLDVAVGQKMQISALMQNVPELISTEAMANAYVVKFPEGMPHTLTALKQGGFGSMIQGTDGKFMGSASFYQLSAQASLLGAFTAMSVVTGQYFMGQINEELKLINVKMDEILNFLYGEKKAELISEISFIKYAYQNFASIMCHDEQKIATIGSLQEAKKVAMKDMEFYLRDLSYKTDTEVKSYNQLEQTVQESLQIKKSIDLSIQLCVMSSLLEMQYAQNMDEGFIEYLQNDIDFYIGKCNSSILTRFGQLKGKIDNYKGRPMEKIDKSSCIKEIEAIIDPLNSGEKSPVQKSLNAILDSMKKEEKYYIGRDGDIYKQKVG